MSPLVDIGANLTNKAFRGDRDAVLRRAAAAGVGAVVVTGTSAESSRAAWELASTPRDFGPRLYATAGIHPHHASTAGPSALRELRGLCALPHVRAVGECGLDYDRDFSPRDDQRRALEAQLELAAELGLPVFLHERAAHGDFAAILARHRPRLTRAVVHCFTGEAAALRAYLDLDLHIGLTGWICDERRGTHLRAHARDIPADRLMLETDAPYILPRDLRPRPPTHRNEPAFLPHVLATVAACRGEPPAALARATTETARRFFDLEA